MHAVIIVDEVIRVVMTGGRTASDPRWFDSLDAVEWAVSMGAKTVEVHHNGAVMGAKAIQ